jgi:hypothetical protein
MAQKSLSSTIVWECQFSQVRPLPLQTVQSPEPSHFEQANLVNISSLSRFPLLGPLAGTVAALAFRYFGRLPAHVEQINLTTVR